MAKTNLNIIKTNPVLSIDTTDRLILRLGAVKFITVAQQGIPGPPGPQGDSSALLFDDPNPTLSADLILNNHNIVGQLETTDLVLDGGLL